MEQESTARALPELSDEGFLADLSGWTREVAEELAQRNEIGPLTEDHWVVIEFAKAFYHEHGEGPSIVQIGRSTGFSAKHICRLFPCGVARGAYRLAGLPRPIGCL